MKLVLATKWHHALLALLKALQVWIWGQCSAAESVLTATPAKGTQQLCFHCLQREAQTAEKDTAKNTPFGQCMLLSHHTQNEGGRSGVQGQPELQLKPREEEGGRGDGGRMKRRKRGGRRGGREKEGKESGFDEMRELD